MNLKFNLTNKIKYDNIKLQKGGTGYDLVVVESAGFFSLRPYSSPYVLLAEADGVLERRCRYGEIESYLVAYPFHL